MPHRAIWDVLKGCQGNFIWTQDLSRPWKFRCECPRCQAIDDTRGMQCDRCGPWGRGVLAVGDICWCSWIKLINDILTWSCFHHFSWVQAQCFSRLNPKIQLLLRFPHFCENLWFLWVTFQFCVALGFWWPLPGRPWLASRFPFQDVDTTGLWGMKRGRPAASARRKQKRQTWRRRAERWRNLEYHLLLITIYRDIWYSYNIWIYLE